VGRGGRPSTIPLSTIAPTVAGFSVEGNVEVSVVVGASVV